MHEVIRTHSLAAWAAVQAGRANPLADLIAGDSDILRFLDADTVSQLMDASAYVGDAPERARALAAQIRDLF